MAARRSDFLVQDDAAVAKDVVGTWSDPPRIWPLQRRGRELIGTMARVGEFVESKEWRMMRGQERFWKNGHDEESLSRNAASTRVVESQDTERKTREGGSGGGGGGERGRGRGCAGGGAGGGCWWVVVGSGGGGRGEGMA